MRVLVSTTAGSGHIQPTVPFAAALQRAGHSVHWATAGPACASLAAQGYEVHPAGMAVAERIPRFLDATPDLGAIPPRDRRPRAFATNFAELAGPAMLDELPAIVDEVAPDLMVHEVAELASAPIATARGIRRVVVAFSGRLPDMVVSATAGPASALWHQMGLETPPDLGLESAPYLHPFPPSLGQRPTGREVRDLRPTVEAPPSAPEWLTSLGRERPIVYATFGTEAGPQAPWGALVDALTGLDVDAVITVGPAGDPDALTERAASARGTIRIERFVPQAALLPRAAVVVSHAGAGTVLAAASLGRPQVLLPMAADQFENADALADAGVAHVLNPGTVDAQEIADSVSELMRGALDEAPPRLAAEFAAMPDADEVVRALGLA